jgi:branched-chain amino acid transport system ATP-binding protein
VAAAYTRNPRLILVDEASLGLAPMVVDETFSFPKEVSKQDVARLVIDQYVTHCR